MSEEPLEFLPEDVFAGRAIPPEMIRDLRTIAQLDAGSVKRIVDYLSRLQGLTVEQDVKVGVQNCLQTTNSETADSVVRTLLNLEVHDLPRTLRTMDRWRVSTEERRSVINDELFASLERNLNVLVASYPSLELIRKANCLLHDVGNEFKSIAFFCDMRPVYDEARENIEGFVALANLRLLYVSQDGERHVCEVALTEDEQDDVVESGQRAVAKLGVLKSTIENLGRKITPKTSES